MEPTSPKSFGPSPQFASSSPAVLRPAIPALSLVMPAFNEEAAIGRSLEEACAALSRTCDRWELIVADDGSTDRSAAIVASWSRADPRIRLVRLGENVGYSRALVAGLRAANFDAIAYTDADAQFDLNELPSLYAHLGRADMVAGYRRSREDRPARRIASRVFNTLQGWVLGTRTTDVNCALKLFRKHFLDAVEFTSDGFLIDAEFFARAERGGFRWHEVPVTHRPRVHGASSVRASSVITSLRELWRLRRSIERASHAAPAKEAPV